MEPYLALSHGEEGGFEYKGIKDGKPFFLEGKGASYALAAASSTWVYFNLSSTAAAMLRINA